MNLTFKLNHSKLCTHGLRYMKLQTQKLMFQMKITKKVTNDEVEDQSPGPAQLIMQLS